MPTLQIHLPWLIEIELIFPIITPNFPDVIFAVIEGLFPSSLRPPETSGASGSPFLESVHTIDFFSIAAILSTES